ncbi:TetR/AcrR family transcriptional regulator [Roseomonas eburnea]|uniref:TetR/AcrR family transcriptional regulator n=1 Tax=Neoroseomonas eburnea TaxID=1346889 RepID=A0A9X9XIZ1_9PROT|nr:TetR/AcrR family transcriptional regulator [Neoroseomonas eburnea]MBR0683677.1 TetR/AcrR family transcriptional regulator [Neoroseomonas eburnea]
MDLPAADTRSRILDAAAALLRRHGPDKLTVLDVAKRLGMSHGNVYRHFPSKQALRAAVAEEWLSGVTAPLAAIAAGNAPPPARLREWLAALAAIKRRKVLEDPEMFAGFHRVASESPEVIAAHLAALVAQVARILAEGRGDGTLPAVTDPEADARAVLSATMRFHHPDLVAGSGEERAATEELARITALLLRGLGAAAAT